MRVWYTASAGGRGGTDEAASLCNMSKRAKLAFRSHACCWRWQFPSYSGVTARKHQPGGPQVHPQLLHTPVSTPLDDSNALL